MVGICGSTPKIIPGSHTVVLSEGREIPDSTLHQAAILAAANSKAADSAQVPVDYTLIKNCQKAARCKARHGHLCQLSDRLCHTRPGAGKAPAGGIANQTKKGNRLLGSLFFIYLCVVQIHQFGLGPVDAQSLFWLCFADRNLDGHAVPVQGNANLALVQGLHHACRHILDTFLNGDAQGLALCGRADFRLHLHPEVVLFHSLLVCRVRFFALFHLLNGRAAAGAAGVAVWFFPVRSGLVEQQPASE